MRRLIGVLVLVLALLPTTAAAQDPVAVSYDGVTFYGSDGGVYDYPTWTQVQCYGASALATVYYWAGYTIEPTAGKAIFAACTLAVVTNALYQWIYQWTNWMMYYAQLYTGDPLHWQFWVVLGGY